MMIKDIPHGHGGSHKRGIIDSLVETQDYLGTETPNDLPSGHKESYRRGRNEGDTLRKEIADRVRP